MTGPVHDAGFSLALTETLSYLLVQIARAYRNWAQKLLSDVELHVG